MKEMDLSSRDYVVQREVFDELRLDEVALKGTWSTKPTLGDRLKDSLRCSVVRLKLILFSWIPVFGWLPHYSIRENGLGDLISGCSVGIMHLPQGMAYALLASLRPVYGLYTSLYPVLVYVIFGTSKHISIGTFAVVSIMVGSVTERLAPDSDFMKNGTNGTGNIDFDKRDAYRVQIACSFSLLIGIFQILLGIVKFGFVVNYLSEPLIRAYTTGSACHVCISQLKYLFGVKIGRFNGPLGLIYTLIDTCRLLPKTKVPELVVSLVALAVLITIKEINECFKKKLPLPIPVELIVITFATIISHYCDLPKKYKLDIVGEIPSGLNVPRVPDISLFTDFVGDAFAVAIVAYAINISLGKTFGLKYGYKVDSNQELVALGLSNGVGGFFQCYAVTSSMSRSLLQESTGGKTQVAGVVSSVIVLITVLKIGSLFEDLPKTVLATIVFVNLKGMFKQFIDVPHLWKTSKVDLMVWLVTFIATILLNLDVGLAVAVGFSMLTIIFRMQLPVYSILGNVPGTDLYLDTDIYKEAKEIPGIKIFRSSETICYTNAEMYLEALQEKCGVDLGKLLKQKKKSDENQKRKQKKEVKKAKREAKKQKKISSHLSNDTNNIKDSELNERRITPENNEMGIKNVIVTRNPSQLNLAYQPDTSNSDSESNTSDHAPEEATKASHDEDEEKGTMSRLDTHTIILDMSATSFVDTVSAKTIKNIFRDFGEVGLDIYLSGCQVIVVEQLEKTNFFESVPKSKLFISIHDAVLYILKKPGQIQSKLDRSCYTPM